MKLNTPLNILMLLFILPLCTLSQSIEKRVINSSGGTQTQSEIKLSSSISEVVVGALQSPDNGVLVSSGYFPALELGSLSIDEFKDEEISIYPNPFTEKISINSNLEDYQISVINMQGVTIFKARKNLTNEYILSRLQTGVYILQIQEDKTHKKFHFKLIKK